MTSIVKLHLLFIWGLKDQVMTGKRFHVFNKMLHLASCMLTIWHFDSLKASWSEKLDITIKVKINEVLYKTWLLTEVEVSLYHDEGETSWTWITSILTLILICKVTINDINLARLWPENKVFRKNMLISEIKKANRPFWIITLKKALRFI